MLSNDQKDFYNRWTVKAGEIGIETIEDCIDKYVSLFITYNALYNLIPEKSAITNGTTIRFIHDITCATTMVRDFLGSNNILIHFRNTDNEVHVHDLKSVLDADIFNISLSRLGVPQKKEDHQLNNDLGSGDDGTRVLAMLKTLYKVRCNIVHGRKNLQPYQTILLQPLINILQVLNGQLYRSLVDYPV